MAIYHCTVKNVSRGKGRSAVAAAAYRAGEKLHDAETGLDHDYTHKAHVVHSEVILCENAPAEYADRQTLWNAVHSAEKASDARLAREIETGLPNELSLDEAIRLARDFGQGFAREGMCVDYAIHWKPGNHHIHYLLTTRPIGEDGKWGVKERKAYALDEQGQRIPVLDADGNQKVDGRNRKQWKRELVDSTGWNSKEKVTEWRWNWQEACNSYLVDYGKTVDCRSHAERGLERIPTIHEGYTAREIEANGGVSERCQINREIKAANKELEALTREQDGLRARLTELLAQIRQQIIDRANEVLRKKRPVSSQQEQPAPILTSPEPAAAAPEPPKTAPEPPKAPFADLLEAQQELYRQTFALHDDRRPLNTAEIQRAADIRRAALDLTSALDKKDDALKREVTCGLLQRKAKKEAQADYSYASWEAERALKRLGELGVHTRIHGILPSLAIHSRKDFDGLSARAKETAADIEYEARRIARPKDALNGSQEAQKAAEDRFRDLCKEIAPAQREAAKSALEGHEGSFLVKGKAPYAERMAESAVSSIRNIWLSNTKPERQREKVQTRGRER